MKKLKLCIPYITELEYRRHLISDKETMSYNIGWGDDNLGCYYQTPEQTQEWYRKWNGDTGNYYAYVVRIEDDIPVGEVNIHWDNSLKKHIAEVIIEAK
ncbi:hypothetical protein [Sedimentibacter sp.]|uniref:hypothetical protein n=1 Tax=Sedimentibacter sp. TaxID=1960295 RepID=UPI002899A971|nr:hypothetical protein [Sedimentibacter sp.]